MAKGTAKKTSHTVRSNNEIRQILLQYFYNRNANATSSQGKKGSSTKISDIRKELKQSHDLSQQEVISNLTYLISQGWINKEQTQKSVPVKSGMVIPSITIYYQITALGIDKIEGPGEFTVDKFKGIKIEATGENIITVGDGNVVNVLHKDAADALAELKQALLLATELPEAKKLDVVADIDSIQSQLAKHTPNKSVISSIWSSVEKLAVAVGLGANATKVAETLAKLF